MTWFQSLDSLIVFAFTPLLVARWARLAQRGVETPLLGKMAFGAAIVGVSYLVLGLVAAWCDAHGTRASWLWLVGWFVLMTTGELYILPVGLGLFGRMAPDGFRATSIATWFFAGFFGNLLAGALGTLWSQLAHAWFFALIARLPAHRRRSCICCAVAWATWKAMARRARRWRWRDERMTMTKDLQKKLKSRWETFTTAEQKIASYLLHNISGIPFETAASLGKRVGVSAMTVGRFLRNLGYDGVGDLKEELRGDAPWMQLYKIAEPPPTPTTSARACRRRSAASTMSTRWRAPRNGRPS